jgi:tetratricopeptide (TPR) repeat protein
LVEVSGQVEFAETSDAPWSDARPGQVLPPGSRLRTLARSRATLQLSDRSVIRLGPSSLLVLQSPRAPTALQRFRLTFGRLFFLDREKPSDIEFETPVATGAIRGTEFVLTSSPDGTQSSLALLDGQVELIQDDSVHALSTGDQIDLVRGQPPRLQPILIARNLVQWCLSYPQVLAPRDLGLDLNPTDPLAPSLEAWTRGAVRQAIDRFPWSSPDPRATTLVYRAALELAAGDVESAQSTVRQWPAEVALVHPLQEVIAAVRFETLDFLPPPTTSSAWLARSYYLQSQSLLPEALTAAQQATRLAPEFGPAWIRVGELEHAFEHRRPAQMALHHGLTLAPDSAPGHALVGFVALAAFQSRQARAAFDRALALDGSLGNAWLGRALTLAQQGHLHAARRDLQIAAALEPQRSDLRSYLGKAWADTGHPLRARQELHLAATLDPGDPTPWLYSALNHFQDHQPNQAVRDLERSLALNHQRSVFRSRLLLDRDRSIRSADLAAMFNAVGLDLPARHLAARAVQADVANFSAHLFLARSLQQQENPWRADLRFETARQNELLLANLLAPPGAGNLSQQLSQQDHLQFFNPRPVAFSSFTEVRGTGEWQQLASAFGSVDGLSYALDYQYLSLSGDHPNAVLERHQSSLQAKQRVGPDDELYFQLGLLQSDSGDPFSYADPAQTDPDLSIASKQVPHVYAGWHHLWAPGQHTLILGSWLHDDLQLTDLQRSIPFLRQSDGTITSIDSQRAVFDLNQASVFTLRSIELQHLAQFDQHSLVAGSRYQSGDLETDATLAGPLPPPFSDQSVDGDLERFDAYTDFHWQPIASLNLSAGLGYHHLRYPENSDLPPLSANASSRDLLAPRLGATWSPFSQTHLRAAYAQSLGGLYYDDSIRLEPTQIAGFTTAYRNLASESVIGLVPGTRFETLAIGLDHTLTNGFYTGIEFQWRQSDGQRQVGAASNSLPLPLPDTPTATRQTLDTHERALTAYAGWLIDRDWSVGVQYRLLDATLQGRFPDLPSTAVGLDDMEQDLDSRRHVVRGSIRYQHPSGWFGEWHSTWNHQRSETNDRQPTLENFWQHDLFAGYRFPRRRAEIRLGILNLTDADHRLHPLTLDQPLPRQRTFTASLRLNF